MLQAVVAVQDECGRMFKIKDVSILNRTASEPRR